MRVLGRADDDGAVVEMTGEEWAHLRKLLWQVGDGDGFDPERADCGARLKSLYLFARSWAMMREAMAAAPPTAEADPMQSGN